MDAQNVSEKFSREPTIDDLISLCKHLNEQGAEYVIIGGFAIIHHGRVRTTADIDVLLVTSPENIERVRTALLHLPDQAVKDVSADDINRYVVVRVADEIVVDLMGKACGLDYNDLKGEIEFEIVDGISIPFLNAPALLRTKQTLRTEDVEDRMFLESLIRNQEGQSRKREELNKSVMEKLKRFFKRL